MRPEPLENRAVQIVCHHFVIVPGPDGVTIDHPFRIDVRSVERGERKTYGSDCLIRAMLIVSTYSPSRKAYFS